MRSVDPIIEEISSFRYSGDDVDEERGTIVEKVPDFHVKAFINQFWTSKQRQANSLHEVSYRACFKPQLPEFFIERMTEKGDVVYDPFSGRGTTPIQAALMGRRIVGNDINPLSRILISGRMDPPSIKEIGDRLGEMDLTDGGKAEMDLSMFYHDDTERELVALRNYILQRERDGSLDNVDRWIRMVATNRLTGHSKGFFSVYTLPPNQALTPDRQILINEKRDQVPPYRDVAGIIVRKSKSLLRDIGERERRDLSSANENALLLSEDAARTGSIGDGSVHLTVTSPPFLNVVQYSLDNWLRCWFNGLDAKEIEKKMILPSSLKEWENYMGSVFVELHRITKKGGWVAFEVGEVRNGKIRLEESVIPLGITTGFSCAGVLINSHEFTKTSNIWGVSNNRRGTNTNRVVLLRK